MPSPKMKLVIYVDPTLALPAAVLQQHDIRPLPEVMADADLILSPRAHQMSADLVQYVDAALSTAKRRKRGAK